MGDINFFHVVFVRWNSVSPRDFPTLDSTDSSRATTWLSNTFFALSKCLMYYSNITRSIWTTWTSFLSFLSVEISFAPRNLLAICMSAQRTHLFNGKNCWPDFDGANCCPRIWTRDLAPWTRHAHPTMCPFNWSKPLKLLRNFLPHLRLGGILKQVLQPFMSAEIVGCCASGSSAGDV